MSAAAQSRYSTIRGLWGAIQTGYQAFKANRQRKPRGGEATLGAAISASGAYTYPYGQDIQVFEQVRKWRLWNYVAGRCIAEEWARQQACVGFRRTPEQVNKAMRQKMLSAFWLQKSFVSMQQHEEIELADSTHPLCQLLRNPNEPDTSFSFWYRLAMFLETTGRSYLWMVPNRINEVAEMWHLFPQWVTAKPGSTRLVDKYIIRPQGYGSQATQQFELDADDVIPILYPSPLSMIQGWSPMQATSEWTDIGEAQAASQWYMLDNASRPDAMIETDAAVHGNDPFTASQLANFYAQWDGRLRGRENHGKPVVMNPGMKAVPWAKTPKEMDFAESGELNRQYQMAAHRVSSTIAGLSEDENYASSITHVANFIQRTMGPKYAMVGSILSERLAPRFDENAIIFWQDNPPTDPDQRNKDMLMRAQTLSISPNEIRKQFGDEPFPYGGDNPISPTGIEMPWVTEDVQMPQDWTQSDENTQQAQTEAADTQREHEADQADKNRQAAKDKPAVSKSLAFSEAARHPRFSLNGVHGDPPAIRQR